MPNPLGIRRGVTRQTTAAKATMSEREVKTKLIRLRYYTETFVRLYYR